MAKIKLVTPNEIYSPVIETGPCSIEISALSAIPIKLFDSNGNEFNVMEQGGKVYTRWRKHNGEWSELSFFTG